MFGQNPVRKFDGGDGQSLAVQSIFYTIQGEGPYSGHPAVFIRLAGCHLTCSFCDTEFESGINNVMPLDMIVAKAAESMQPIRTPSAFAQMAPIVVVTGGEPLRQEVGPLTGALLRSGFMTVQFETAGNLWRPSLLPHLAGGSAVLVVSPKTPHVHPDIVRWAQHYKYVLSADNVAPDDGLPSRCPMPGIKRPPARPWTVPDWVYLQNRITIWVSPCDDHEPEKNARNVEAAKRSALQFGHRLSLQTHKLLGLE